MVTEAVVEATGDVCDLGGSSKQVKQHTLDDTLDASVNRVGIRYETNIYRRLGVSSTGKSEWFLRA